MAEDRRKIALKRDLHQLTSEELRRLLTHLDAGRPVLLDRDDSGHANYSNGTYCPLAIAVGIPGIHQDWYAYDSTDDAIDTDVGQTLEFGCGFTAHSTRGVRGVFYTTSRRDDLTIAACEVLDEKGGAR